jgi:hypothetical protein
VAVRWQRTEGDAGSSNISRVFVVFSNHLDVGYTDSSAAGVVQDYWDKFFPAAIATANEFRQKQPTVRFRWIVSMFRHCNSSVINVNGSGQPSELKCPSAAALAAFEQGARAGDIGWHAFPFNAEPEVYDRSLFLAALNLTHAEDEYYNHSRRITYSQRDVPGLTRAAIPLLASQGVKAVTVGENKDCGAVNVPPIFRWRDGASTSEVIALFHPGGYGRRRLHSEEESPEMTKANIACCAKGLPKCCKSSIFPKDCVAVPAAGVALCYAWKQDNQGPHGYNEAMMVIKEAQKMYPGANVTCSDAFDDFIRAVEPAKSTLAIVTAEIGDSWIHGSSADPVKVALFRAASRHRARCVNTSSCDPPTSSPQFRTFERLLMKVGEHTWGWAGGHTQTAPWDNAGLAMKIKDDASYAAAIASWTEQRSFVDNAVAALGEGKLADDVRAEWHALAFAPFDSTGFAVANASVDFQCGSTAIGFHAATGGVRLLRAGGKGHNWATPQHQLLAPWYQNVDAEYIKSFDFQYGGPTMGGNFGKAGLNLTAMNSTARLVTLLRRVGSHNTSFILKMAMDEAVHQALRHPWRPW